MDISNGVENYVPLMKVWNSSCFTFPFWMSILKVIKSTNRNLCSSYKPLQVYLNDSYVKVSIMFCILLAGTGLFSDL